MHLLTIVIPVYNEEKRLDKTFKELKKLSAPRGFKLAEVIFVDDGSTDNTKKILRDFAEKSNLPIGIISYDHNKGKGHAVRIGMLSSSSDYSLLCDADMSTPLSELKKLTSQIEKGSDVVIGTRKNGKSSVVIEQSLLRKSLGKVFTRFTQIALNLQSSDFTCGFKLLNSKAVKMIFSKSVINRWGYDAEILYIAKKEKLTVTENHVLWSNDKLTHVNIFTAVPSTILELSRILMVHSFAPAIKNSGLIIKNPASYITKFGQRVASLF